jgi:prostaglandin-endoperoxide synthase 2
VGQGRSLGCFPNDQRLGVGQAFQTVLETYFRTIQKMFDWLPSWALRFLVFLATKFDRIGRWINAKIINEAVGVCRTRPHPWSTVHDYTSWTTLSDTHWSARHLPAVHMEGLPDLDAVKEIFRRPAGQQRLCPKSTCLFPAFAQYLTDGFIRTRMPNTSAGESENLRRQNTSNHQIDLCSLYGRTSDQTDTLRLKSDRRGEKGRLKSQFLKGEEYAPFLYGPDGQIVNALKTLDLPLGLDKILDPGMRLKLFAFGGDRANANPQVAMINTLLLREHNRLAGAIEHDNPTWDDERVFQTARNALIVIFIRIVIEEYINHIAPSPFRFRVDAAVGYDAPWYRTNWITTEFSLLYRWHSLLPDKVLWGGALLDVGNTFFRNDLLLADGLLQAFAGFGSETAGRLGARNTAEPLLIVEKAGINQGRICDIGPYCDYREYVGLKRPDSFEQITSDGAVQKLLRELYRSPSRIEFYPGLFAEEPVTNSPLPPLILRMVAVDAFSQALTNPLLSQHVFNELTFSEIGWRAIETTRSLSDLLERNSPGGLKGERINMTRSDWQYIW